MKRPLASRLGVLLLCAVSTEDVCAEYPLDAHLIISRKAIDVMPGDIASLFRHRIEEWQNKVVEPARAWRRDRKLKERRLWHDVAVDITTDAQNQAARIHSLQGFPRDKESAKRLYRKRGYYRGGLLPWAIERFYGELVEAFRSGDESAVIRQAGYLVYFAANAANPFRVSANAKGQFTENLRFGHERASDPLAEHHSVRERFGVALVSRRAWPYASAVNASHADYDPILEPVSASFAFFEESLAVLDEVAQADREILNDLEVRDRRTFEAKLQAYYDAMHDRCGDICVERLEAGAIFAANLIGGAWQAAGQPTLETIRARAAGSGPHATPANPRKSPILGSRHSVVFHKNDCPFAKQIANDNLVTFPSALEARRAGRRGCKRCQP
ncbi:MAG: hypothetical protein V3W34_00135 [Phycisphaerae bacterium]